MDYRCFLKSEYGGATIDWLGAFAVMVAMGLAISESTDAALTERSANVRTELQGGQFETAWDDHLVVQAVLEEDPCDINGNGNGNGNNGNGNTQCFGNNGWGNGDQDATGNSLEHNGAENDIDDPYQTGPDGAVANPNPVDGTTTTTTTTSTATTDPDPATDPTTTDPDTDLANLVPEGCPSSAIAGTAASGTGGSMWTPDRYAVVAGGDMNLGTCSDPMGLPGDFGFFSTVPTFTFTISGMQGFERLEIETRGNGSCDTVLLVRDTFGNWYFDDDGGRGARSKVDIYDIAAVTGRVDVWVGTYGAANCDTVLEMESW